MNEFVQFIATSTTNPKRPLETTKDHFVFLQGQSTPVRADAIHVGDISQDTVKQSLMFVMSNGKVFVLP